MRRNITIAPVTRPAPPALDVEALSHGINSIVYQLNVLACDVEGITERIGVTETSMSYMMGRVADHQAALDDLHNLIDFLEKNPGCDLKDWARYEAVKERMGSAA